jgi:Protein of unknown function (DUF1573)
MKAIQWAIGMTLGVFCGSLWTQAASAEAAGGTLPNPKAGQPKIKFDQTVYDFGKTSQVETVSGTFKFQNAGDSALKMGKPSTSCGCTVAGVKPEVLQPGERGELTFTMNLGRSRALLQKQITVESNDPENPKTVLTVKADYAPLYEVSPFSFYVNLRQGEKTNLVARVTRTDGKPLKLVNITPTQSWIEAKIQPETPATDSTARIEVTVKPGGAPRYFTDLLNAFVEGSDRPAFNVPISGRLTGDLVLTPESLYWPITDPEKVLNTRRIQVTSSRAEKLELKNLSSSLGNVTVEAVSKEDDKTLELVAKLVGVPERSTNGVIRFETNVPDQPTVQVPVMINVVKR